MDHVIIKIFTLAIARPLGQWQGVGNIHLEEVLRKHAYTASQRGRSGLGGGTMHI
ncbi:MAG: hypothetical protein O3A36_02350 [bacterium]|nr:hypothetical protein [bacterium]